MKQGLFNILNFNFAAPGAPLKPRWEGAAVVKTLYIFKKDNVYFNSNLNRAKAGVEPTASAHEAEILPLNYFAIKYMIRLASLKREANHISHNKNL